MKKEALCLFRCFLAMTIGNFQPSEVRLEVGFSLRLRVRALLRAAIVDAIHLDVDAKTLCQSQERFRGICNRFVWRSLKANCQRFLALHLAAFSNAFSLTQFSTGQQRWA